VHFAKSKQFGTRNERATAYPFDSQSAIADQTGNSAQTKAGERAEFSAVK
jgi:hypothetical protein